MKRARLFFVVAMMVSVAGCVDSDPEPVASESSDDSSPAMAATAEGSTGFPFLQFGVNAARTGFTPDAGPTTYDLAFSVEIGENASNSAEVPVIIDGMIYTITGEGLWAIDTTDASATEIVDLPAPVDDGNDEFRLGAGRVDTLASDGQLLFLVHEGEARSYQLDGELQWSTPLPHQDPYHLPACSRPALTGALVVFSCAMPFGGASVSPPGNVGFSVTAIRIADGEQAWQWLHAADETVADTAGVASSPDTALALVESTAIVGELFLVSFTNGLIRAPSATFEAPRSELFALDMSDGELQWRWTQEADFSAVTDPPEDAIAPFQGFHRIGMLGFSDRVYITGFQLVAMEDPPQAKWTQRLTDDSIAVAAIAAVGEDLIVPTQTGGLFRVNSRTSAIEWRVDVTGNWGYDDDVIIAGGRIFGVVDASKIVVHSLDGEPIWSRDFGSIATYGVGEGILVVQTLDGRIDVVGETPASMQLAASISDAFPAAGQTVSISIEDGRAGIFGGPDEYRIDWGDGAFVAVNRTGEFEHTYQAEAQFTPTVLATNAFGQEASHVFTVDVGGTPPEQLNFVQQAFAPKNYDLTFGVLGLAIAITGGLIALARQRRRRGRISNEIIAIERAADASKHNTAELAAAMQERRAHVRGLLLDGRIDESQLKVLEDRIDELARGGRIGSLRGRFDFLPHGFVMQVQEMLADGRLSGWEYEQLDNILAADTSLTGVQKKRVRGLLSDWAKEDA